MDDDLKKLRKVTAFMRKQGVLRVKTAELEIELSPAALTHGEEPTEHLPPTLSEPQVPREPTDDERALGLPAGGLDLIDWSSPGALMPGVAS